MRQYLYTASVYLEPNCPAEVKRIFLDHGFSIMLVNRYTNELKTITDPELPVEFDRNTYYCCLYNQDKPCDDAIHYFIISDDKYIIHSDFSKILSDK